jgi:SAM-dependent methyltransferase
MSAERLTWEEAVKWLRSQPEEHDLVLACYYDDPLISAARRFEASEEWQAVRPFLPLTHGQALDLGAGRGISSFALAQAGWNVTALEPDASAIVGTGAIESLACEAGLSIHPVQQYAESLPFRDMSFDLVYGRQVLHHAHDLRRVCAEIWRVLKPGGRLIATREHVISRRSDLERFHAHHPLHRLYGGESAYLLGDYVEAIACSGLRLKRQMGPYETVINYSPLTTALWHAICAAHLSRFLGRRAALWLIDDRRVVGRWTLRMIGRILSQLSNTPGRLFSFVAERPVHG